MTAVTILKLDHHGRETWRYLGRVLEQADHRVVLEASFNRDDGMFEGVCFKRGDRFVEVFYSDRWYNIFEVHDRDDGQLKCWYCNVGYPAVIEAGTVSYRDLALDLLVYPDGTQRVLDMDEFDALDIDEPTRQAALNALQQLKDRFDGRVEPL